MTTNLLRLSCIGLLHDSYILLHETFIVPLHTRTADCSQKPLGCAGKKDDLFALLHTKLTSVFRLNEARSAKAGLRLC